MTTVSSRLSVGFLRGQASNVSWEHVRVGPGNEGVSHLDDVGRLQRKSTGRTMIWDDLSLVSLGVTHSTILYPSITYS